MKGSSGSVSGITRILTPRLGYVRLIGAKDRVGDTWLSFNLMSSDMTSCGAWSDRP
jgi:hypothetical protein